MKRIITNVYIAAIVGFLIAVGAGTTAQAAWSSQIKQSQNGPVVVENGQTHKGSLYSTGKAVRVAGDVAGDVYCGAERVEITGSIKGGLMCAAQHIVVNGSVGQGVRLAAQSVVINGQVEGDVSVAAQNITIGKEAHVGGDVNGMSQSLVIDGVVHGGLRYGGGSVAVNGSVMKASDVSTPSITFGAAGRFNDSLHYSAEKEIDIDKNRVAGNIEYNNPNKKAALDGSKMIMGLLSLIGIFITTGMIVALLMPRFVERSSELTRGSLGTTFLAGSAVVFVLPIVAMMLFLSYFGAYIALIMLLVWVVILLLSGVFFAYYMGSVLLQSSQNILVRMIGGLVIVSALMLIPFIQIVAIFASILFGSGILVRALFNGRFGPFRYSLAPEPPMPPMPKSLDSEVEERELEKPKPIAKKTTTPKKPAKKSSEDKK